MTDKEKTDKGFEIFYYNLSYRRRFIRVLWITLIAIPLYFIPVELTLENFLFGIVMTLCLILGLTYNYRKWKLEQRENQK